MSHKNGEPRYPYGRVTYTRSEDGRAGALVAVVCRRPETVRRGAFVHYGERLCQHVLDRSPADIDDLAGQDWSYEGGTVEEAQLRFARELGEAVRVSDLARLENPEGLVWGFTRPDASAGVMLSITTRAPHQEARRAALHLAGLVLLDPVGECGVAEGGELQVDYDPMLLVSRPWEEGSARTVQEALVDELGSGARIERYFCFRVGA